MAEREGVVESEVMVAGGGMVEAAPDFVVWLVFWKMMVSKKWRCRNLKLYHSCRMVASKLGSSIVCIYCSRMCTFTVRLSIAMVISTRGRERDM